MRLMFPHKIDRYRIIRKLVMLERLSCMNDTGQKGIDQVALAIKSRVSQATISNLENIEKSVDNHKRVVSRQDILKVLTQGMKLGQKKIDAILWLYDGTTLSEAEIHESVIFYQPDASPGSYTYDVLRGYVLELLAKALNAFESENTPESGAKSIFTTDKNTLLYSIEAIYEVEKIPGHSVLVSKHPPFLTRPGSSLNANRNFSEAVWEKICAMHDDRRKTFFNSIEYYGHRSIHQKSCIEKYFSNDHPYKNIRLEDRRVHIQTWIEVLKSYPGCEAGLTEAVSDMVIINKCNVAVMVRPTLFNVYPDYEDNPFSGLRFVHWTDEVSCLRFFLECEKLWDNISVKDRTKECVIDWLGDLLKKS